ncbi:MAG: hypothetical protein LBH00_01915, partial [Planctomycetaceae bacterium]|nr:hypothetical protein [Planctomycetaceae bacterium]
MSFMQNTPFRSVSLSLLILFVSGTFAEAQRVRYRSSPRKPSATAAAAAVPQSPDEAKQQLRQLAADMKTNFRPLTEKHLLQSKQQVLSEINTLSRQLSRTFDRAEAADWKESLKLAELKAGFQQKEPAAETADAVWEVLRSDTEKVKWTVFDGLRTALRRYRVLSGMLAKEGSYERQLTNVCENLAKYIDLYSTGQDPSYAAALSDTVAWLDDIEIVEPRAGQLAGLARSAFSGVNVRLAVGSDFAVAGFRREIDEVTEIRETISGTRITGSGTITGSAFAELANSPKKAVINVVAEVNLDSVTDGVHPPVQLKTHTTGTMRAEKPIVISAESITSPSARTKAKLKAETSDVRINAGPLVKAIARGQIADQTEESQREAARRAERKMNVRLNDQIDPNIEQLNEKYQKIRSVLVQTGLFPRIWNLSSTGQQIEWSILFADNYQPSAPAAAPAFKPSNGLSVQIHQSALNNAAAILLSGRLIDEEKSQERLTEFFGKTPKFLERKTEDAPPAKVSFGAGSPVDVTFLDNKIRVVVHIDNIQVMNNSDKSYTISVEYRIKTEKKDGREIIVLEQTEAEAFPSRFKQGNKLSATATIIRSYLLRRLEALPKRQEMEPLKLEEGEWADKGQLVPLSVSADKG